MSESDSIEAPDLGNWMTVYLSVRRSEYEEQYAEAATDEERSLYAALDRLERHCEQLVTTGVVPSDLVPHLSDFKPGDAPTATLRELLQYQIVQHRLEFDVAQEVNERLYGLSRRVQSVAMLTMVLLGYSPSESALKYFQRATKLYLAGYDTETIIMCGAVLEAALANRFPDELLRATRWLPAFRKSGVYSIAQRMKFEESHAIFNDQNRKSAWQLITWRNDAVHVQPDIGPKPEEALVTLVVLLLKIMPGELADSDAE